MAAEDTVKLIVDMGNSAQSVTEVTTALDKQTAAAVRATQAQKAVRQALDDTAAASRAVSGGGGGGGGGGQGILGMSYAIQDFTSQLGTVGLAGGLRAVQNNIPQILAGLGAGAGLAGVVSIASVAVGQLIDNWGKLSGMFGSAGDQFPKLKEGAAGLASSLKLIGDELEALATKQEQLKTKSEWIDKGAGASWSKFLSTDPGQNPLFHLFDTGGGGLDYFEQVRKTRLEQLKKEGEERLRTIGTLGRFGPESTEPTQGDAKAFQDAIRKLPEGVETLLSYLQHEAGLGRPKAEEMVSKALEGREGMADEIARIVADMPEFAQIEAASPLYRKMIQKFNEQAEVEKRLNDEKEKVIKQWQADNDKQMNESAERAKRDEERRAALDMRIAVHREQQARRDPGHIAAAQLRAGDIAGQMGAARQAMGVIGARGEEALAEGMRRRPGGPAPATQAVLRAIRDLKTMEAAGAPLDPIVMAQVRQMADVIAAQAHLRRQMQMQARDNGRRLRANATNNAPW